MESIGETALNSLRTQIAGLRQISASKRWFVDPQDLQKILTEDLVTRVVRECSYPEHDRPDIVKTILQEGSKTFAILLQIEKQDAMTSFIHHGELDGRLPTDETRISSIASHISKAFCAIQWEFLPHVFQRNRHCHIRDDVILPFTQETRLHELEGGFGDIFEISIVHSMQNLVSDKVFPPAMELLFHLADVFLEAGTTTIIH